MRQKRLKIAKRLRIFKDAERVGCSWDWKVNLVRRGDLNKDAGVWSTFVQLAR
jgi:hypothetical protein